MDEAKLKKIMENIDVPAPDDNARKRAVNLAVAEFKAEQQKNEKAVQGTSFLSRLMGKTNPKTRRDSMETIRNRKLMYGGMATAMAVVLITGISVMQLENFQADNAVDELRSSTSATLNKVEFSIAQNDETGAPATAAPRENEAALGRLQPSKKPFSSADGGRKELKSAPLRQDLPMTAEKAKQEMGWAGTASMAIAPAAPPVLMDQDASANYYKDVGRDKFEDFEINPVKSVSAEPVSTFSVDVDTASYSFMRRQINNGVLPQKDSVRVEEMINYFDYNYPLPETKAQPFKPTVTVVQSPWNGDKKLIHIGIKGYDVKETQPHSNLVFLLDTSGSMNAPDKLPLVINSMKLLLDSLKPDDTVAIAVYAGSAGTVLEPTKVSEKQKIIAALENLSAGGSTAGAEGINLAYNLAEQSFRKDAVNRVILATDGDFNVGITNPEELQDFVERKREKGIFLSVLGFGEGNYNDQVMQTLAQNGNGVAAYIDNLNEARKVLVDEATSTLFPIAKDVKIQVEFNPKTVAEYRLVGYETRALKREDFNNDKVDAGDIGAGHAVTAIYEITPVGAPTSVDPLRYGTAEDKARNEVTDGPVTAPEFGNEFAFLKIRYKLPDENTSRLITTPVTDADQRLLYCAQDEQCKPGNYASNDVVWATAVASFGQILKGGQYTGGMKYDDVIKMAQESKGNDPFGYRAEFINLVRLAKSASEMQPR